jgi:hypothetical protein
MVWSCEQESFLLDEGSIAKSEVTEETAASNGYREALYYRTVFDKEQGRLTWEEDSVWIDKWPKDPPSDPTNDPGQKPVTDNPSSSTGSPDEFFIYNLDIYVTDDNEILYSPVPMPNYGLFSSHFLAQGMATILGGEKAYFRRDQDLNLEKNQYANVFTEDTPAEILLGDISYSDNFNGIYSINMDEHVLYYKIKEQKAYFHLILSDPLFMPDGVRKEVTEINLGNTLLAKYPGNLVPGCGSITMAFYEIWISVRVYQGYPKIPVEDPPIGDPGGSTPGTDPQNPYPPKGDPESPNNPITDSSGEASSGIINDAGPSIVL